MKTITTKATIYDAQGYKQESGATITDHGDTLGIGRGEHLKSDLEITENMIESKLAGWTVEWKSTTTP